MQEIKRTFAAVATLLRDIRAAREIDDRLTRRIDQVSDLVTLAGNYIVEREYPEKR
jgi:hypothetical protein